MSSPKDEASPDFRITGKSVDTLRAEVLAKFDKKVLRLDDMFKRFLQLIDHQLTALTAEAMEGLGYKAIAVDAKVLSKVKDLGATFNSATDAKIRLDKAIDKSKKEMTEEDEEAAVTEWIQSRDSSTRGKYLFRMVKWHNEMIVGETGLHALAVPAEFRDAGK